MSAGALGVDKPLPLREWTRFHAVWIELYSDSREKLTTAFFWGEWTKSQSSQCAKRKAGVICQAYLSRQAETREKREKHRHNERTRETERNQTLYLSRRFDEFGIWRLVTQLS